MAISFEIISNISDIETIVIDKSIREISRLRKSYGPGRLRKMKGKATMRLPDGTICEAELHRYEAHGIGRKDINLRLQNDWLRADLLPSSVINPNIL
jgi:hypothetical protein